MIIKFSGQIEIEDDVVSRFLLIAKPATAPEATESKRKAPTEAAIKKKAAKLVTEGRVDDLKDILEKYGVKKVPDLAKDKWADLAFDLDEALAA